MAVSIALAGAADDPALWRILEPTIRAGETYALPPAMSQDEARAYWHAPDNEVFVASATDGGEILGTYVLRPNNRGNADHICNCGYMTAPASTGKGVARAMCTPSLQHARARGYLAMQFNYVVSANERAVRLWQSFGFEIIGRIPRGFRHPRAGLVDAFVMHRFL
jgi:RimJ/RimL family protein N-acetyltransferase